MGAIWKDMSSHYRVTECFYSPQGEGVRVGTMNVFVRLANCNLRCDIAEGPLSPGGFLCDTEFLSHQVLTIGEIISECKRLGGSCDWIVLTGGEPLLQVDTEMISGLHDAGYHIAIETNGTREIPEGIDWVCVSPKVAEHALKAQRADELKYVRYEGQGIPRPRLTATHYLISPAWSPEGLSQANLDWCIGLVRENPTWRLSLQIHKLLQVR